jgi:hypothetical protein
VATGTDTTSYPGTPHTGYPEEDILKLVIPALDVLKKSDNDPVDIKRDPVTNTFDVAVILPLTLSEPVTV